LFFNHISGFFGSRPFLAQAGLPEILGSVHPLPKVCRPLPMGGRGRSQSQGKKARPYVVCSCGAWVYADYRNSPRECRECGKSFPKGSKPSRPRPANSRNDSQASSRQSRQQSKAAEEMQELKRMLAEVVSTLPPENPAVAKLQEMAAPAVPAKTATVVRTSHDKVQEAMAAKEKLLDKKQKLLHSIAQQQASLDLKYDSMDSLQVEIDESEAAIHNAVKAHAADLQAAEPKTYAEAVTGKSHIINLHELPPEQAKQVFALLQLEPSVLPSAVAAPVAPLDELPVPAAGGVMANVQPLSAEIEQNTMELDGQDEDGLPLLGGSASAIGSDPTTKRVASQELLTQVNAKRAAHQARAAAIETERIKFQSGG